jgi:dienelactone hydrolase
MRPLAATTALTLLVSALPVKAAAPLSPQQVDIAAGSLTLHAQLFKPDGNGPFPTVIALHSCGGLAGHSEPVLPRYRDWAEQFVKGGKAVLLPDSYGSRGLGPQCRVNVKERRLSARRERVADIAAARQWLTQQSWVAQDRISLIGWANGASALLWAVRPQNFSRGSEQDFRSAIAFYPDCRISAGLGWSARVPTLLLIGAKDDVSSPPACRQMIDAAR